jgi:hypothetical protein
MCSRYLASPRFLAAVAVVILMQAFAAPYMSLKYLSTMRRTAMSWRSKPTPKSVGLSMHEMQGILQASTMQTDAQMAKELEKKGYIVKKAPV